MNPFRLLQTSYANESRITAHHQESDANQHTFTNENRSENLENKCKPTATHLTLLLGMHMGDATASSTAPAFLWTRVPSEHEHGFPSFFIQLLEQQEGLLFQSQAAFLVAVDDVQCVLPPVVGDVVAFEGLPVTHPMSMMHDIEFKKGKV